MKHIYNVCLVVKLFHWSELARSTASFRCYIWFLCRWFRCTCIRWLQGCTLPIKICSSGSYNCKLFVSAYLFIQGSPYSTYHWGRSSFTWFYIKRCCNNRADQQKVYFNYSNKTCTPFFTHFFIFLFSNVFPNSLLPKTI